MDLDIGVPAGTQLPFGAPARRLGSSYSRRAVAKILWSYRLLWMWAAGKGCLSKGPDGLPGLVQDDRRTEKVWLAAVPGLAWCSGIRGKTLRACRCRDVGVTFSVRDAEAHRARGVQNEFEKFRLARTGARTLRPLPS